MLNIDEIQNGIVTNAVPRIKDIAYGIAKSNDHQGVLEVIKQEVLNEL